MLKSRPKTWAIFALVCVATYLISFVVAPWVVSGITKLFEIDHYESQIKQEQQATEPDSTNPSDGEENSEKNDIQNVTSKMIDIVSSVAQYVGIMVTVFGIFNFILAFKDEDSERTSRGIMLMVMGAAMIGMKAVVGAVMK